jgi:hypothetical protein
MIGALLKLLSCNQKPVDQKAAAQQRLAEITLAKRDSYAMRRFRERRTAALRGKQRALYLHTLAQYGLELPTIGLQHGDADDQSPQP